MLRMECCRLEGKRWRTRHFVLVYYWRKQRVVAIAVVVVVVVVVVVLSGTMVLHVQGVVRLLWEASWKQNLTKLSASLRMAVSHHGFGLLDKLHSAELSG